MNSPVVAERPEIWLLALIVASAVAYSAAMVAMKAWTIAPAAWLPVVIVFGLAGGVACEILVLREERLGMIYVAILGVEVLVIAAASVWFFKEVFSLRELMGCALVIVGTALAWV